MALNQKTTVYLDQDDYQRLKVLARKQGRSPAELVREAVHEYGKKHAGPSTPRSIGSGRSGRSDLSMRAEALLRGMGKQK